MSDMTGPTARRRVGWRLLSLLWVWALLVFVVVDLFLNVLEFDHIRPDAAWYRATRFAAHKIVGEAYTENDMFAAQSAPVASSIPVRGRIPKIARQLRVVRGVPPDHATSYRIQERLHRFRYMTHDPARRDAALRAIERLKVLRTQTSKKGEG